MIPLSGIILAGGRSTRMGTDKALANFKGKKLIEHSIHLIEPFCNEIIISANTPVFEKYGFKVVGDEFVGCGPLCGIYSAIKSSLNHWNLVIGCDTPFVSPLVILRLLENFGDYDYILPIHDGNKEPLAALYHKNCLPELQERVKIGNYKLMSLFDNSSTCLVDVSDLSEQNHYLFLNLNSPDELLRFGESEP